SARAPLPLFFLRTPRPPMSPLFPYTTLFRSISSASWRSLRGSPGLSSIVTIRPQRVWYAASRALAGAAIRRVSFLSVLCYRGFRSEEHTSELQSRFDLVCRLLLERKKGTR